MSGPGTGRYLQPVPDAGARELFVRHVRKGGRPVAVLRALDRGGACVVEAEVFAAVPAGPVPLQPGPRTFPDAHQASAFMTEALEALMAVGCDVQAE